MSPSDLWVLPKNFPELETISGLWLEYFKPDIKDLLSSAAKID